MIPSGDQWDRCFPEDLIRRQAEVAAMNQRDRVNKSRPAFPDFDDAQELARSIAGNRSTEE